MGFKGFEETGYLFYICSNDIVVTIRIIYKLLILLYFVIGLTDAVNKSEERSNFNNCNFLISERKEFENKDIYGLISSLQFYNSLEFKEALLRILQLYFDGLVEGDNENYFKTFGEQHAALNSLLRGAKLAVSGFYRKGGKFLPGEIADIISPYFDSFRKYGSKEISRGRTLYGRENGIFEYALDVAFNLNKKIDLIVPIASGGFEPALLLSDYLGVDSFLPVRFSRKQKKDISIMVPPQMSGEYCTEKICGKNVLVVDDLVEKGITASRAVNFVNSFHPREVFFTLDSEDSFPLYEKGFLEISSYVFKLRG